MKSAAFLQTFIEYPPSQAPGSFTVEGIADQVNKKIAQMQQQGAHAAKE
jgi:hypothetical protein